MKQNEYLPEGRIINRAYVREYTSSLEMLEKAIADDVILEGKAVLCDEDHNLYVELGEYTGIIPKDECSYSEGTGIKDIAIISRVGKIVSFKVRDVRRDIYGSPQIYLSRRAAQRECMQSFVRMLCPGDIIEAKVTHMEPFGAFVDIGCGVASLLSIDCMSVSRISHPKDRFYIGQCIRTVVKTSCDEFGRVSLTHRELLGTWEENVENFNPGQTVPGIIRSVEKYGVFVELAPNLAGLAEFKTGYDVGMSVSVYIKNIIPEKMKIKLVLIDRCDNVKSMKEYDYYIDSPHIDYWKYSPEECEKLIESSF